MIVDVEEIDDQRGTTEKEDRIINQVGSEHVDYCVLSILADRGIDVSYNEDDGILLLNGDESRVDFNFSDKIVFTFKNQIDSTGSLYSEDKLRKRLIVSLVDFLLEVAELK